MISRRQRRAGRRRFHGQIPHSCLHHHHRQPERPGDEIEEDRGDDPALGEPVADMVGEQDSGDRLRDHRGRGEDEIGGDDDPRGRGDGGGASGAVRHQHEEGDAGSGPEQDSGADDVKIFEGVIGGHSGTGMTSRRPDGKKAVRFQLSLE
jgi:hypothetical protein